MGSGIVDSAFDTSDVGLLGMGISFPSYPVPPVSGYPECLLGDCMRGREDGHSGVLFNSLGHDIFLPLDQ